MSGEIKYSVSRPDKGVVILERNGFGVAWVDEAKGAMIVADFASRAATIKTQGEEIVGLREALELALSLPPEDSGESRSHERAMDKDRERCRAALAPGVKSARELEQ